MNATLLARSGICAVSTTTEIDRLLARDAVVAIGVSGGKDSQACALAVHEHLERIRHAGPRVLVHADLGRVEWQQSLAKCQELATHLGYELIVKRRAAGDLMDRWLKRWSNNVARYTDLSCVKLILPWSTPSMRFCTSELKTHLINGLLKKRYPAHDIVNVTGVRAEESANRARMPVAKENSALVRRGYVGMSWNAILPWSIGDVKGIVDRHGLALHEAYTLYKMSRVSCVFCIMSSAADLLASTTCVDNQGIYREMVDLEIRSTFAFQGQGWLGDIAPALLTPDQVQGLARAKAAALMRQQAESQIPKELLYTKNWPTRLPTLEEASLLASIRRRVGEAVGIPTAFVTPESILSRYAELLVMRDQAGRVGGAR